MLGGLLLGVIEALAAGYIAIAWKDAIAFLVLILILIIRPTGILASARRTNYEKTSVQLCRVCGCGPLFVRVAALLQRLLA